MGCAGIWDVIIVNDFTKGELETIYLDMNHSVLKYGKENVAPFYLELRDKVERMIDNYCEHNERVSSSDENGHMLVMCGRCALVLWYEKD